MEKNIFATVVDNHSAPAESKTVLVLQLLLFVTPILDIDFSNKGLNS